MTLDQMKTGQSGRIDKVDGDGVLTQRLLAMGLLPGSSFKVIAVAPLGDPLTVELRGSRVSLRRVEAAALAVTPL
ncbi:MAG: ferrous iron transport protein A [Planctomycetes bacterium]|nr:ferrous iron transport protein A [Planctomycetota bacterium]